MRVLFMKTAGGFAEWIDLDRSMTIEEFFSKYSPNGDDMDYLIRVNSQPQHRYYVLKNDDRITIIALEDLATP